MPSVDIHMAPINKPRGKGIAEFKPWNHPLVQAHAWGFLPMYGWQVKFIIECSKPRAWVCGSFANESGKTSLLVSLFGLSVMSAFPGAKVISTAGTEDQIRGQLFDGLQAKIGPYEKNGWKCNVNDLKASGPSLCGMPPSTWEGIVPRSPLTFEGYHGKWARDSNGLWRWMPICIIFDESKSIDDERFEAVQRIDPDWFMAVSSPGRDHGWFYEAINPEMFEIAP